MQQVFSTGVTSALDSVNAVNTSVEHTSRLLVDTADMRRVKLAPQMDLVRRGELSQYLTPAHVAKLIASQFTSAPQSVRLLDAGAGVGVLTAATVWWLLSTQSDIKDCTLVAYEIEPLFIPFLEQTLIECCEALESSGIRSSYNIVQENFIIAGTAAINPSLFSETTINKFTHAILNPPYKKISSQSVERKSLSIAGIETTNLYSAFVWLSMLLLHDGGELAAITPRSFCNGSYFRPFRKAFLEHMSLDKIHVFESRSTAFAQDEVLQENIVFHAVRQSQKSETVAITSSRGGGEKDTETYGVVPFHDVVAPDDAQMYINIATGRTNEAFRRQMEAFPCTLSDLGLDISTGPVVDFRLKPYLAMTKGEEYVPLYYPESLHDGKVVWPPTLSRKPMYIRWTSATEQWLNKAGWYVLTKRFSSKEEKRRVVAVVCQPIDFEVIGIENHLNYYHANGQGMIPDLARGLSAFLNSTLFDNYFRQFSGHTQVNATDLRKIRYPHKDQLINLGRQVGDVMPDQTRLDELIQETLQLMDETNRAYKATKRVEEALDILKDILAPREQQNERSALCLLALVNIEPDTPWSRAEAPRRRITDMMDWFRDKYGKDYKPNTRETVRRQTMHQFAQMGLIDENPDDPQRPINSPHWCYQLRDSTLNLLRTYGSSEWTTTCREFQASASNQLRVRKRDFLMIPVTLPDGRAIALSAGGQNLLIKDILEQFCPRFVPGGIVLYVGDAAEKFIINETAALQEMGVKLDVHGKMPDVVIYHEQREWIILVEAVTSHGPVDLKRRNELKKLFGPSQKGLVYVTAFPTHREMNAYLAQISWETEVWLADNPDHMIHFNGERFLGPYES